MPVYIRLLIVCQVHLSFCAGPAPDTDRGSQNPHWIPQLGLVASCGMTEGLSFCAPICHSARPSVILRAHLVILRAVAESTLDSATRPGGLVRNDGRVVILRAHLSFCAPTLSFCAGPAPDTDRGSQNPHWIPQLGLVASCGMTEGLSFCAPICHSARPPCHSARGLPPTPIGGRRIHTGFRNSAWWPRAE